MSVKKNQIGIFLFALILVSALFVFEGCKKGPNLKGAQVIMASWSGDYDVDTYQPRNEGEELQLEYRKRMLAEAELIMKNVELAGWDDYFPMVVNNIMSGNKEYSTYALPADWAMVLYKQGLLFPLSDSDIKLTNRVPVAGQKQAYNKMMEDLFTFDGKQYAFSNGTGGDSWQGNFVFWNKRLFREAGLDPDLLYDLQKDGTWTWDKFLDIAKQLTRDINNSGIIDQFGLPCDDPREVINAFVYGNNANYVTIDTNGRFHDATQTPEFIEALQFYQTCISEGVMKLRPQNAAWDWDFTEFFDGKVGMLIAAEWRKGQMVEMKDDYGCVLPPKGPRADNYRMGLTETVNVVPNIFTKEEVDVILKAVDLWNTPMQVDWKGEHYWAFRDRRAVDETVALTKDSQNYVTYRNFAMVPGYPQGDLVWDFWEMGGTPAQRVEEFSPRIRATIEDANR